MIDNTLDSYNNWSNVSDYESYETTVTLLDKNGIALAKFNYPKFTAEDFNRYINNST